MAKPRKSGKKSKSTLHKNSKEEPKATSVPSSDNQQFWIWATLLIFAVVIFFVRWRLFGVPLERDEGEYAYMGQLMLQGIPPYEMAYNMKLPGTHFMYALFMGIFGQTTEGIHFGLALLNIGSIILLYLIAMEFMSDVAALLTAMVFGVLSIGPTVVGFALHATHFVSFFGLIGIWVMLRAFREERFMLYFWAGLSFGLAFIMKQSGVFLCVFGALAVLLHLMVFKKYSLKKTGQYILYFGGGGVFPFVLMMIILYATGAFANFWFWTFTYLKEYGSQNSATIGWENFYTGWSQATQEYYLLWILAGISIVLSIFGSVNKEHKIILWLFALFAFLTIVPGFYFRSHYYVTLLPVVGLFCGLLVDHLGSLYQSNPLVGRVAGICLLLIGATMGLNSDKDYLFNRSPDDISRDVYGFNPFPEAAKIGEYIKANSNEEDRILVFGSEPQIYFHSDRISSTGYIYTYNMMEDHPYNLKMQHEMVREVSATPPKFIVYVGIPTSWLRKEESETYIFDWINEYMNQDYTLDGIVDLISREQTIYKWGLEAKRYRSQSEFVINVYRRN